MSSPTSSRSSLDSHPAAGRSPARASHSSIPTRSPGFGVNPSELVGKVLKHVRQSSNHPTITLHFSDNTVFRVLVVGYDPVHRGVPKHIEMDPDLEALLLLTDTERDVELTVSNAVMITLADIAYQVGDRETRWNQNHSGLALRFREDSAWHCIWATLTEYDIHEKTKCTFRSYNDVYLDTALSSGKHRNRSRHRSGRRNH